MEVYILVELFQGVINNARVFTKKKNMDHVYMNLIKENFDSEFEYRQQIAHGMPDYEFHQLTAELEQGEDYVPDVDIEFEGDEHVG